MMEKIYLIDDGNLFQGTLDQFRACFFSNADEEMIRNWCNEQGFTLRVIDNET